MIGTPIPESSALRFPPTSHICGFYETEEEHRALVTPFLLQGLERGERVVYITDAHSPGTILEYLRDGGVDTGAALECGQLVFRTAQETYLPDGRFDPDRMLALLRAETERALADGFTGLRMTGEMTWALRGMPGHEFLSQYEARVNELLPDLPFIYLCQYDRRQFGPDFLLDMLWCHPLVASGGQVYENHHYVPRRDLPDAAYGEARVQRWLEDLAERSQIEDQARRMSAALLAIARPARQMAAFLDPDTLLREVVYSLQVVTGAYNVNVFLLTDAGLVLAAGHGGYEDGRPPVGYRLELGQGIIGTVAQTGRPLLVPDVRQDPRYLPYGQLPHTRSELAVPVKSGEQLLGVLDVQSTVPDAFDQVALEAMNALADQLAVALENARLFGELSRRLQEMSALHDNALRLAEAGSLDRLLEAILRRAMALLRARGGGIYFYDPVADGLEWIVGQGIGRENVGVRLRMGEGLSGRALQERRPLKVDDYRTWEGRSPLFEGQPLGAVAAVPLLWQEETIGVLTVSRMPEQPSFSEDDMRLLTLFGQQAASAIATARAREAAERRVRQLAIVNEIGQALAAAPDLPTIYRTARDGVRRLVDAPVFGISLFDPQQQTITAAFMAEGDAELDVSQFPPLAHVPDAPGGRSRAIATGHPELISDLSPAYEGGKAIVVGGEPYTLSALYVPMVVEGQAIGLVEVQSYRRAAYTPEDAALLQTVANQIGLAIQNARLLQEARRLAAFNAEIVNSLAEGIIITDETGHMTFVNPAAARLLGYEPQELTGQHRNIVLPPDQQPIVQRAVRRRRRGVSDRYELEMLRKDGRRVPVLVSGVPRFDETGRFIGTLAVFTDISERKRAEEALRRYAERLQVLRTLDAAILAAQSPEEIAREALRYVRRLVPCHGAGVVTYRPATREGVVLAGDADSEIPIGAGFRFPLVGVDREIEASQRGEVLFVPDISALPAPSLAEQALLAAGVRAYIAVPLRAGGGLRGWLAVASATPGALTAEHVEILQEVSAQLAVALYQADLRAALAAQEARLSALVERLPEGVLLLDCDHRILLTNRAAEEFLPVLADARQGDVLIHLAGRPLGEFLVVPPGDGWHEVALPHLRRTFQVAARPISGIGPNGGWVLVIREVTRERFLQAQLEQQERLAAVGQLASGIAHDFNNLLTTTILYAQMALESPDLPSDLAQSLQVIIGESRQATQLVQQILDFSRRAPMEARPMDLAPFLKEVTKVLERAIPENIRLRLVTRTGPFTVQGDPTRLRQAVVNMVLNARDAMPQGGEVRLGLSRLTVGP
ncbi:MAG: GAF domain-containing protein [Thermoflexales bacterium]|nr:GAF domain-containing protein [Thermoflexales bacterium]